MLDNSSIETLKKMHCTGMASELENEYSGAAEPPFRKIGNRESETGNRHTDIVTFASLLA